MQIGTSPSQETSVKAAIVPGEREVSTPRESDRWILQELEDKIEAKLAEREANWLRGLYLLCAQQWDSDIDIV